MTRTDDTFLDQARQALPVCVAHCRCPDRWHLLWTAIKATGLMRGLHLQQQVLHDLLRRLVKPGPQVLIAGAADAASLEVLCGGIDNSGARYTVADLCPAPLHLVRERAAERSLSLHTAQVSLDRLRADRPWDLVFVHNTLGFMAPEQRLQFLRHAREDLAAGGVVLCAVREKQAAPVPAAEPPALRPLHAQAWAEQLAPRLEPLCGGRPDLLAAVLQAAPAYALARQAREDSMPTFRTVVDEFAACGMTLRESHRNPGLPVSREGDVSAPGSITNWLAVFAPTTPA